MRRSWFLIVLCLPLLLCGCAQRSAEREFFAMDTVMQLRAYGPEAEAALAQAEAEIYRLEGTLSCRDEHAALSRLNEAGGGTVSEETAALLQTALTLCEKTGGAYDPSLGALSQVWGFSTGVYRVPEPDVLAAAMQRSGAKHVKLDGCAVTLENGVQLDLGGIAKGYAADLLRAQLEKEGVTSATLDLGGDVFVMGRKTDGSDWRIAVKDPADTESYLGVVSAADKFIVTSGVYERYFEENGVRYHHILDPKTGCPAESGLVSVTVLCENGAWADALSTACFVLGPDGALALRDDLADQGRNFELILATDDGRVLYTDGLADAFTPNDESGYTYEALA